MRLTRVSSARSGPSPADGLLPSCLFHYLILVGYFLRFVLVQFVLDELLKKMGIGAD